MSARASGYMKGLVFCPNGERLTPREKLVGMVLADSHQDKAKSFTYPSVETIAEESLSDKRTCQRYLDALERKGVIVRLRPKVQGRGGMVFYYFLELDTLPEGWQDTTLFDAPIFMQKGGERVAEGWRKGGGRVAESTSPSYIERAPERKQKQEPEQKQIHPLTPASQGPCVSNKEPDHASTTKSTAAVEVESRPVQGFEENRGLALALAGPGMPNSARGSGSHASHVDRFDPFVDQVMQGCGFTSRRLRPVLEAVVQLQADLGEHPATTALAMKAAWRKYVLQDTALRFKWGARKFFGEGYWKNETSWPWDNEVLKDKRNAMQAGVGSWR